MLTVDDLNKEMTKFVRANGLKPTKLLAGRVECEDINSWSYFPHFTNDEKGRAALREFEFNNWEKESRKVIFGLGLVKVDKQSYLELK
jgi:hypothetical protein